ncbi:hypothetical protein BLNAU_1917 [Blattamonas nauphoetae]|uniref:Uncharacterized protein n=1 Tax=Blattamonas nauphoetae TaxID=2049346 RepID=A0ABQ9YGL0_9EUKA|nr:hypothetical protein BLNAU_1917 [Blattamonas nauphoetae]
MYNETDPLNPTIHVSVQTSLESRSTINTMRDLFLNHDTTLNQPFEDWSALYGSLVSLVRDHVDFDDALQDKAVNFLHNLNGRDIQTADETLSDFSDSVCVLLSSPHSKIVVATLSFVSGSVSRANFKQRLNLLKTGLISKISAILQPHTLPFSGNADLNRYLFMILHELVRMAEAYAIQTLAITEPSDQHNHRELVFRKVIHPSSPYLAFLCRNRYLLEAASFPRGYVALFSRLLQISPYHRPTLEFVLSSPVVTTVLSFLSFVDESHSSWLLLIICAPSLREWQKHGAEVVQCGKRMINALIREGMADTLEQMMRNDMRGNFGASVVTECEAFTRFLGANLIIQ